MSENAVSYDHLLELARRRALDGKGGLAASIAEHCLDANVPLSRRELALTFEILRMLIDQVEVSVRRNIADHLSMRRDVPKDLISFLANDSVHVAYPVLRNSPILETLDLIQIIGDHKTGHALAIAERMNLPADVSHHLIELDDQAVDLALARNLTAQIDNEDLSCLVDRSVSLEKLHEPLAHRGDLSDSLARRLFTMVGETLRNHISVHYDIDSATVDDVIDSAVLEALDSPQPLRDTLQGGWSIDGSPPGHRFVNRLRVEGTEGAALIFAERMKLPLGIARWVFDGAEPQILAVAMKGFGLSTDHFVSVLDLLGHMGGDSQFERLLAYYERIEARTAAMVVSHWRTRSPIPSEN